MIEEKRCSTCKYLVKNMENEDDQWCGNYNLPFAYSIFTWSEPEHFSCIFHEEKIEED